MGGKKKFDGPLAIPIVPRTFEPGMIHSFNKDLREARIQELKKEAALEIWTKLRMLRAHYDIENGPDQFLHLSIVLAREFVPGFREKAHRGRKTKWTLIPKAALIIDMEKMIRPGTSRGATWAATNLAKREPWKSFLETKDYGGTIHNLPESLRRTYQDNRYKGIATLVRAAFNPIGISHKDAALCGLLREAVNKFLSN